MVGNPIPIDALAEQAQRSVAIARDVEARLIGAIAHAAGIPTRGMSEPEFSELRAESVRLMSAITHAGLMLIPRSAMTELVSRYVSDELERVKSEGAT